MIAAAIFALAGVVSIVGASFAPMPDESMVLRGLALWLWAIAGLCGARVIA